MAAQPQTDTPQLNPQLGLGATVGLICLLFLPMVDGGYSGLGYQIGFVLLPIAAALAWGASRNRPPWAVLVLTAVALGLLGLGYQVQPGRLLWYYALHIPAAWVIIWVVLGEVPERQRYVFPALVGGALATALYGWFLLMGNGSLNYQINSTFGLKNAYAGYLLLAWPVAAVAAYQATQLRWRWIYALASVVLLLTLVFTYSRAAWLTLGLQLVAFAAYTCWAALKQGRGGRYALAGLGGVAVLLLAALASVPLVRETMGRVLHFSGYSMQGRLRFWQAALEMFGDHPLGVGLGNFAYFYPQYQRDFVYYSVDPHSWPLQLMCELGVFGVAILLALLAGFGWWLNTLWRSGRLTTPVKLLFTIAVGGSLLHAAVDFDYTFSATTATLGAVLALGTVLATGCEPRAPRWLRPHPALVKGVLGISLVLLFLAALFGELLTLERYQLDRLRDAGSSIAYRRSLLEQAVQFNRYNHKTQYELASILANSSEETDRVLAVEHNDRALELNPRYAPAWVLKGLLADDRKRGAEHIAHALALDPYNYPDHYFYWASLAENDQEKRERLMAGLEAIPITEPITPEHVRPTWYELNRMWAEWYYELARIAEDAELKEHYRSIGAEFQAYWETYQQ
jgi:hypothetical protein